MVWTFIGGAWYDDDGGTGAPPGLPAQNPTTNKAWKNNDRFDDAPPPAVAVTKYAVGWHSGNYAIRHGRSASFAIMIDTHQKKHISSWLSQYGGAPGTKFPKEWANTDVIAYAEAIVAHIPVLGTAPVANQTEKNVTINIPHTPAGKPKVNSVIVNTPTWDASERTWAFHFYPA